MSQITIDTSLLRTEFAWKYTAQIGPDKANYQKHLPFKSGVRISFSDEHLATNPELKDVENGVVLCRTAIPNVVMLVTDSGKILYSSTNYLILI